MAFDKAKTDADDIRSAWKGAVEVIEKEANTVDEKVSFTVADVAGQTIASAAGAAVTRYKSFLLTGAQHFTDDAAQATRRADAFRHGPFKDRVVDHEGFYNRLDHATDSTQKAASRTANTAKVPSRADLTKLGLKASGVFALGGIIYDITNGKPWKQAVVSGGAGIVAGMGTGALIGTLSSPYQWSAPCSAPWPARSSGPGSAFSPPA